MLELQKRVLVIAPHPDDEVLGCGGIIKRLTDSGIRVTVLVASRGKEKLYSEERILNVRKQALEAHRILGVRNTVFFDYPAPELDLVSISELSSSISKIITREKPDTVFLPHHGDIHHDHRAIFNAGLVASRPVNDCSVKYVFCYETLSESEWAPPFGAEVFIPQMFVNITKEFSHKIDAMRCYTSQIRNFPNPRSEKSIEALANFRGSTVGIDYAEAFMVIRIIH
jgi:LmbE family N-acetylglucosaminyl deacetylase